MELELTGSVGYGGTNGVDDVKLIRALLNVSRRLVGREPLSVVQRPGQDLNQAISDFQTRHDIDKDTGIVRNHSRTMKTLLEVLASSRTIAPIVPPSQGSLTWSAEGQEGGRYHSRILHVPSSYSGLTLGRGFDLRERDRAATGQKLASAGIDPSHANRIASGVRLKGRHAEQFIIDNDLLDFEISANVQLRLFEIVYAEMESDVVRICSKRDVIEAYGHTDWGKLDPLIQQMLVDLRYRGDYTGSTRRRLQPAVVANDLSMFRQIMQDTSLWSDVPPDRFQRRVSFLTK